MHSITLLGILIIGPSILMEAMPFLGAAIFYGLFISLALNAYLIFKLKRK